MSATTARRERWARWFALSEREIHEYLGVLPFESEEVKRDFAEFVAILRYTVRMARMKCQEILEGSPDPLARTKAVLLLMLPNFEGEPCEEVARTLRDRLQEKLSECGRAKGPGAPGGQT